MAKEQFPRIRDDKFTYAGMFNLPMVKNGRLDRVIGDLYGTPTMYKAFAAANQIRNPMALRGTIRPVDESIRNELILKGYSDYELEEEFKKAKEAVVLGDNDWMGYSEPFNGVITEAVGDRNYVLPSPDSVVDWYGKYNELKEDE
ncbi:hypothetical protein [Fibrobacter sp.]|uniref:hypothetical protein n=1 Tax=Fibrobacter sp. TaxID=35828 RepID=UPI00386A2754